MFDSQPLVVTATNICVDMTGCYFGARSLEGSVVRVFSAENIKDGVEKTEVTPPISGFAYNAFAGCHLKKLYAANDDFQEVSSVFCNPDIAYTGVNPLNILSLENASLV